MAGRSGETCSRMEVNYRPQPDVSTALDMTKKGCYSAKPVLSMVEGIRNPHVRYASRDTN